MLKEIFDRVLKNYENEAFIVRQKARVLLYFIIIATILILLVSFIMNFIVGEQLLTSRNAMRIALLMSVTLAYHLLKAGKYDRAANIAVFSAFIAMALQVVFTTHDTIYIMSSRLYYFCIFILICMVFAGRLPTLVMTALVVLFSAAMVYRADNLAVLERRYVFINFSIILLFVASLSYLMLSIVEATMKKMEEASEKEKEHSVLRQVLISGREVAARLAGISDGLAAENRKLAERTAQQSASLGVVNEVIEATIDAVRTSTQSTSNVSRLAAESSRLADEGVRLVQGTVETMRHIKESGAKITGMTELINDVAFQTNILSLNAAIEAARAGEQGRGFGVVAAEVRKLALRSGEAVKEINVVIEQTTSHIVEGSKMIHRCGEMIRSIQEAVSRVSGVIAEIAARGEEQNRSMEQIGTALNQLVLSTEENAGLVEKTANVGEKLGRESRSLTEFMRTIDIDVAEPN